MVFGIAMRSLFYKERKTDRQQQIPDHPFLLLVLLHNNIVTILSKLKAVKVRNDEPSELVNIEGTDIEYVICLVSF